MTKPRTPNSPSHLMLSAFGMPRAVASFLINLMTITIITTGMARQTAIISR